MIPTETQFTEEPQNGQLGTTMNHKKFASLSDYHISVYIFDYYISMYIYDYYISVYTYDYYISVCIYMIII